MCVCVGACVRVCGRGGGVGDGGVRGRRRSLYNNHVVRVCYGAEEEFGRTFAYHNILLTKSRGYEILKTERKQSSTRECQK